MKYAESTASKPPKMPRLEDMPFLMRQLSGGWLDQFADKDRIVACLGAVPHIMMVPTWHAYLINAPKAWFTGGPLWFRYNGSTVTRVHDEVANGEPVGRRLVQPGEIVSVQGWRLLADSRFERIADPNVPVKAAKPAPVEKPAKAPVKRKKVASGR